MNPATVLVVCLCNLGRHDSQCHTSLSLNQLTVYTQSMHLSKSCILCDPTFALFPVSFSFSSWSAICVFPVSVFYSNLWFSVCYNYFQVPYCGILAANMVVWSGWGGEVPIPCWYIYSLPQASSWKIFQKARAACMLLWTHSWLGYKTSEIWVDNFWWSASIVWVLFGWHWARWCIWQSEAWMLDKLQGRRICGQWSRTYNRS